MSDRESWAADLGAGKAAFEAGKRQTLNGNSAPSLVTLSKSLFLPGLQFHHHKRGAKASSSLRIRRNHTADVPWDVLAGAAERVAHVGQPCRLLPGQAPVCLLGAGV